MMLAWHRACREAACWILKMHNVCTQALVSVSVLKYLLFCVTLNQLSVLLVAKKKEGSLTAREAALLAVSEAFRCASCPSHVTGERNMSPQHVFHLAV
jgi:hypothetical protein